MDVDKKAQEYNEMREMFLGALEDAKKHSQPSPRTKIFIEEWQSVKKFAWSSLFMFICVVAGYGIWVGSLQTQVGQNQKDIERHAELLQSSQERQNAAAVSSGALEQRLINIENTLIEIKNSL